MSQEHFLSIARRLLERDGEAADSLSTESDYFFTGAQRHHQLETIRHLASFGDMLLFLEAESGAGKSTLLRRVAKELSSELQIISTRVDDDTTPVTLVQDIAGKSSIFAAPSEDLQSLLGRCKDAYQGLYSEKTKRTLLIIDDAHRAEPGLIKSLLGALDLPKPNSPVVVLLSSARSPNDVLGEFESDDLHALSLSKLKRGELRDYIHNGLKSVGYSKELNLSDSRLDSLYVRSGGLIKSIETYMGSAIFGEEAAKNSEDPVTKIPARLPAAALITIVVVLVASFLFVAQQHDLFSGLVETESEGEAVLAQRLAQQERLAMLDKALEHSKKFDEPADVSEDVSVVSTTAADVSESTDPSLKDDTVSELVSDQNENSSFDLDDDGLDSVNPSDIGQETVRASDRESGREADSELAQEFAIEAVPEAEVDVESVPVKTMSTSAIGSEKPKDAVKTVSVVKEVKRHPAYRDYDWIMSQPEGAHSFQVLGSYNESTATRFIDSIGAKDLYYVESSYKGRRWYVVLYGVFPDIGSARLGVVALPPKVSKEKPWIRSLSGLK